MGPANDHVCLVFEPLREPVWVVMRRFIGNSIPPELLKLMALVLLHGYDYLHETCRVIHTGKSIISSIRYKGQLIIETDSPNRS